jgi:hypothetical protein
MFRSDIALFMPRRRALGEPGGGERRRRFVAAPATLALVMTRAGASVFLAVAAMGCGRLFFDRSDGVEDAGNDAGFADAAVGDAALVDAALADGGTDGGSDAGIALRCPDGYLAVGPNELLGTAAFCVMRFEAKAWLDDGDRVVQDAELAGDGCDVGCLPNWAGDAYLPASVPAARPWREVKIVAASRACRSLGAGYDLISNPEAMAVAREIERVAANWFGGVAGTGRLPEGRTGAGGRDGLLDVQNALDPYDGTGHDGTELPGAGWEQRRALLLASGESIWDFSGNVQEWIDWAIDGDLDPAPECPPKGYLEITSFVCPGFTAADYDSSTGTYDSGEGVGQVLGGAGRAMRRGGQIGDVTTAIAGIYGFNVNRDATFTAPGTGFRCVYRP